MYNNFNSSFTSDILAVDKTTHDGYGKSTYTTTSDKLWVVSLGELSGASVSYSPAYSREGTQYKWFSDMGVSTTNDNYCLACYPRMMDFSMDSQFISWYVMKFVERSPYLRELTAVQTSWSGGDDVTWKAYGIFYKGDNGHAVMTTDNFSYGYPGRVSAITPYSTSGLANDEYTGFSATGSVPVAPAFCF